MNTTSLPLDFPGLQEEARRLARELIDADDPDLPRPSRVPEHHVRAQARLLANLNRPESRDRWAALMADELGLPPGLTAPNFAWSEHFLCWLLARSGQIMLFADDDPSWLDMRGRACRTVPGLPGSGRSVEALCAILHAVFRAVP